jgi:hypothetical protein
MGKLMVGSGRDGKEEEGTRIIILIYEGQTNTNNNNKLAES